jgi:hypothetical protein
MITAGMLSEGHKHFNQPPRSSGINNPKKTSWNFKHGTTIKEENVRI